MFGHPISSIRCTALVLGAIVMAQQVPSGRQSTEAASPYVLRVPHESRQPVGLLYTPEMLAILVQGRAAGTIPKRISDAIHRQTPMVVMWVLPHSLFRDHDENRPATYPRPYRITIVEAGNDPRGINRIEPVWIAQDASDLRQLDPRTAFQEVGAVAAFPRSAFVPGRLVFIHTLPYVTNNKSEIDHRMWATIEWNGAAR